MAVAYGPSGRRRRWIALVEVCPRCGRAHVHYGTPAGPPRRRSCGGHQYLLHAIYGGHSDPAEVIA
ncbi:hypothetical protein [Thermomonospora sp. CIF 1]|uniref:hypothetical protein n=1 Tax=Thermomonospora sp. CIF 1 TaxID=1916083 RepID=UPI00257A2C58|nr:hypothetical protein [Thermomonospora sp. CIF 1]